MKIFKACLIVGFLCSCGGLGTRTNVPANFPVTEHKFSELFLTSDEAQKQTTTEDYCAVWAAAVIEKQHSKIKGTPSQNDWLSLEAETNFIKDVGVQIQDGDLFFLKQGLHFEVVDITDSCEPYYYAAQKLNEGCEVEISMINGPLGHIEAVLGIEDCTAITNSWGRKATVSTKNGFKDTNMEMFKSDTNAFFFIGCQQ